MLFLRDALDQRFLHDLVIGIGGSWTGTAIIKMGEQNQSEWRVSGKFCGEAQRLQLAIAVGRRRGLP
jgi:hypothetical protein